MSAATPDPVNHPSHYTSGPNGIECIDVVEGMSFTRGNAVKYLWRAGLKGETTEATIQDLEKAVWYIQREITTLKKSLEPAAEAAREVGQDRRAIRQPQDAPVPWPDGATVVSRGYVYPGGT